MSHSLIHIIYAFSLILLAMLYSYFTKKINFSGAVTGAFIAVGIFLGGSWICLLLLFLFFFSGTFASRWKKERKIAMGLMQENKGIRTHIHAIANGGSVAVIGYMAYFFNLSEPVFPVMIASGLATACSDTWSSEFGNVHGRNFYNILTFKKDQRGLDGVISLEGSLYGLLGALLIGGTWFVHQQNIQQLFIITTAGLAGNMIDSYAGAIFQRKGLLNNHQVNFIATTSGAFAGGLFYMILF